MSEQLFYVLEAEAGFDLDIGAFADSLEGANAAADIAFSNEGATIIDAFLRVGKHRYSWLTKQKP